MRAWPRPPSTSPGGRRSRIRRSTVSSSSPIRRIRLVRKAFNPNDQLTLLTVVLTGAAVIRERAHGTLEHLFLGTISRSMAQFALLIVLVVLVLQLLHFAMVGGTGVAFFAYSVARFRKSIAVSK